MKKPSEIQGLLVNENRTFYYLETGNITIHNHLDRIQKVLLAKDIITYTGTKEDVSEEKLRTITLLEAQEKGYNVQVLYLNSHIKANTSETPAAEGKRITWGKKK
jgi:hypothetical protein